MSIISAKNHNHPPHILIFPYPAQGHMLALLDLTHQLCLRGLTATVVVTPKNLPILTPLLSTHPSSVQTLLLPFPKHPKIPPGIENVKDIGNHGNIHFINALSNLHDPIIHWFNSHSNPPVALISDFFLGHALRLAQRLDIPRIAFYSTRVFLEPVLNYCWHNLDLVRSASTKFVELPDLPGSPSIKVENIPSVIRLHRGADTESDLLRSSMLANAESWGCVFNSFVDLEGKYMDHLKKKLGHSRVYGVGPLNLIAAGVDSLDRGNPNNDAGAGDVVGWLDGCPDGSVLYVCFGSQVLLSRDQMKALACGLERSGVRFVWAVKMGSAQQVEDGFGVVPDGFEERVAGRGLVIRGWAPQVLILAHQAVGGFLSHCGWNSVLEAVVAGVSIWGWPMEADQFVNAMLVVDDMGMAVRVCEGKDSIPDSVELGKVIAESMSEDSLVKTRAKELSDKAFAAVRCDGSSSKDLNALVKELCHCADIKMTM